jgi:dCMP deaminase
MLGSVLYLAGTEAENGKYVENTMPCSMCKRLIINSGILKVIIRENIDNFYSVDVKSWIESDESLTNESGY